MIPTVAWDDVLGGMLAQLAPLKAPETGATEHRYVRVLDRYLGEFESNAALPRAGIAGRTPAVLVDFAGEQLVKTTIGRKVDKVKATFLAICASDSWKSLEDRRKLHGLCSSVRRMLGARKLGLPLFPLQYVGLVVVSWEQSAYALGVKFTTIYHTSYELALTQRPIAIVVTPNAPASTTWGYRAIAEAADGTLSDPSDQVVILNGAAALSESVWHQLVPSGSAEAIVYHLYRTTAPFGVSLGFIGDSLVATLGQPGAAFNDVGQVAGAALPSEKTGTSYDLLTSTSGELVDPNTDEVVETEGQDF